MVPTRETAQRISFLNLEPAELELLRELRPLLEKHADAFVAAFYRHLLSFQGTRQLLRDPAVKERLLVKQRGYLLSLSDPRFDDSYIAERRRIGEVHERIGLEPRWYLGAFSLYFSLLTPVICEDNHSQPERGARTVTALQKLLMFDAQLAMEAYIERHERELRYLTHELEREGRRLGRDYATQGAELRRTRERAQTAEELASIATLAAGLAHEIGTPMSVIQGHAKLLEPAVSGEDAQWRLQTIQEQIARISRIIQTLLNMARPGRSQPLPVELEPLIENTLSFLSEKLARRGIEPDCRLSPVGSIIGDSERLQQLFLNLFLNAADAMEDGGRLEVSLQAAGEGEVEVTVSDTGVGIPEADLSRIFEPFFTTKESGQGNGLGLMVAKRIVSDHGGTIRAESAPGEGTCFRILLPLAQAGGGTDERAAPA